MLGKGECQVTLLEVVFLSDSSMQLSFCFSNHVFFDIYSDPREKRLFLLSQTWSQVCFLEVPTQGEYVCIHTNSFELSLTLCDPMDCSLPGSSVYMIVLTRIVEWVAMPSSRGSSRPRDLTHISYISFTGRFFITNTTWEGH